MNTTDNINTHEASTDAPNFLSFPEFFETNDDQGRVEGQEGPNHLIWQRTELGNYPIATFQARIAHVFTQEEPHTFSIVGVKNNGEPFSMTICAADFWNADFVISVFRQMSDPEMVIAHGKAGEVTRAIHALTLYDRFQYLEYLCENGPSLREIQVDMTGNVATDGEQE